MKQQKVKIEDLDERVSAAKSAYNDALKRLEEISEEIHRLRKEREGEGSSGGHTPVSENNVGPISMVKDPMDDVINRFNAAGINSTDEYLDFPQTLGVASSPVRQKKIAVLDCPHMYQDFSSSSSAPMVSDTLSRVKE